MSTASTLPGADAFMRAAEARLSVVVERSWFGLAKTPSPAKNHTFGDANETEDEDATEPRRNGTNANAKASATSPESATSRWFRPPSATSLGENAT